MSLLITAMTDELEVIYALTLLRVVVILALLRLEVVFIEAILFVLILVSTRLRVEETTDINRRNVDEFLHVVLQSTC